MFDDISQVCELDNLLTSFHLSTIRNASLVENIRRVSSVLFLVPKESLFLIFEVY